MHAARIEWMLRKLFIGRGSRLIPYLKDLDLDPIFLHSIHTIEYS